LLKGIKINICSNHVVMGMKRSSNSVVLLDVKDDEAGDGGGDDIPKISFRGLRLPKICKYGRSGEIMI